MTTKKYSLRKVKVGVASVLVGFGIATTGAAVANAADVTTATPGGKQTLSPEEVKNLAKIDEEAGKEAANKYASQQKAREEANKKAADKATEEKAVKDGILQGYDKLVADKLAELTKAGKDTEDFEIESAAIKAELEAGIEAGISTDEIIEALSEYKPTDKITPARGEQLIRNSNGDVVLSIPFNAGGIPEDIKAKINQELDRPHVLFVTQDGDILIDELLEDLAGEDVEALLAELNNGVQEDGFKFIERKLDGNNIVFVYGVPAEEQPAPAPAPAPVPGSGNVTGGNDFGQKAPEVKNEVKEASASLPNTGLNSTSTTVAGLGLIALVGLAVRRKLAK